MNTNQGPNSHPAETVNLFTPLPDVKVLGDVVVYETKGLKVPYGKVVQALRDSGLPDDLAPLMLPRNAFRRAAKKLEDRRIIRKLKDDRSEGKLYFQSTLEQKVDAAAGVAFDQDRLEYVRETTLVLDKDTGNITISDTLASDAAVDLLDKVRAEFADVMGHRTGSDVGRMVQKAFEKNADLFPLRRQGGVYFCPTRHADFTARVADFLARVGGRMKRIPVPDALNGRDNQHVKDVKESVADALAAAVREYQDATEALTDDATEAQMERLAERIKAARFKVEAYSEYIEDRRAELLAQADAAADKLRERAKAARDKAIRDAEPDDAVEQTPDAANSPELATEPDEGDTPHEAHEVPEAAEDPFDDLAPLATS